MDRFREDRSLLSVDRRVVNGTNKVVNELFLDSDAVRSRWQDDVREIVAGVKPRLEAYLSSFGTVGADDYRFSHACFWEQREGEHAPLHYDAEFIYEPGRAAHPIRNFLCLIYMNDDYEAGELIFPLQKKVYKPRAGSLVLFPTSFMFPHQTAPSIGNDRYLMRLAYYLDVEKKARKEGYVASDTSKPGLGTGDTTHKGR